MSEITITLNINAPSEAYGESSLDELIRKYNCGDYVCTYEIKEFCRHEWENLGASRCIKCGKLAI